MAQNLNKYFNRQVCLALRPVVRSFLSVQKLVPIPAVVSQNFINKLVRVKSEENAFCVLGVVHKLRLQP